ncbi:MAG: pimeloyl-ACP methyl ester carboxylesterase, partial [Paracoccaceae bacterium]
MTMFGQDKTIAGLRARMRAGDPDKCLVMLHGIGSNSSSFDRLAAQMPDDITLIAWNAPGYPGSAALPSLHPVAADYAQRLLDLATALTLPRFTLLGHSLGTLIATEFAALYPQQVNSLILLACAQGYGIKPGTPLPDKAAKRLDDLATLGPQTFAQTRAPNLMHAPDSQPDVKAEAIKTMASITPDGYAQAVHMLATGTLLLRAADVATPSLVLVGAKDRITPPTQSLATHQALQQNSPNLPHIFA